MKLAHGLYNFVMALLFMYQGSLGLQIRSLRKGGAIIPSTVKRHRKQGPLLALLGIIGFISGAALVSVDTGKLLKYPLHLAVGITLAVLIITTFLISRKIKGLTSQWRTPHFVTGITVLFSYVVQLLIGLGLLF